MGQRTRARSGLITLGVLGALLGYAIRRLGWWFDTGFGEAPLTYLAYPFVGGVVGAMVGFLLGASAAGKNLFVDNGSTGAKDDT